MTETNPRGLAVQMIEQTGNALSSIAAAHLVQNHPELQDRAKNSFDVAKALVSELLEGFLHAIHAGRDDAFDDHIVWTSTALAGRGLSVDWLRAALDSMMHTLSNELPAEVQTSVATMAKGGLDALERSIASPDCAPRPAVSRVVAQYILHLLEGDRDSATQLVLGKVDDPDSDIEAIYLDICLAAQREIGEMWHRGEVSIAEEHFVSESTQIAMSQLLDRAPKRPPNGRSMVALAIAGDRHSIGIRCVADFFAIDGWRTIFLGSDIPPGEVARASHDFDADLITLSATLPRNARDVTAATRSVRAVDAVSGRAPTKILVGGRAFQQDDNLWQQVGADAVAQDAREAVRVGRLLVGLDS